MNPITSVWQFHVKLVGIIKHEGHGLQVNYIAVLVQPLVIRKRPGARYRSCQRLLPKETGPHFDAASADHRL